MLHITDTWILYTRENARQNVSRTSDKDKLNSEEVYLKEEVI